MKPKYLYILLTVWLGIPLFLHCASTVKDQESLSGQTGDTEAENSLYKTKLFGQTIIYEKPDESRWKLEQDIKNNARGSGMIMYMRVPVYDNKNRAVKPVIAILYEEIPREMKDVVQYYIFKMSALKSNTPDLKTVDSFDSEKWGLKYDGMIGFIHKNNQSGVIHTVITCYMLYKDIGVTIMCDSTEDVFDQVEDDMRRFIKSVTFENK